MVPSRVPDGAPANDLGRHQPPGVVVTRRDVTPLNPSEYSRNRKIMDSVAHDLPRVPGSAVGRLRAWRGVHSGNGGIGYERSQAAASDIRGVADVDLRVCRHPARFLFVFRSP